MPKKKIAWKLTLLLLIFIAPLLAAIFVYQARDGLHFLTKNTGQLIKPSVSFQTLGLGPWTKQKWSLVYFTPTACDEHCVAVLTHFEVIRESLVKDANRLNTVLITQQLENKPSALIQVDNVFVMSNPLPAGLPTSQGEGVWLMDPLGNIILNYSPQTLDNRLLLDLRHLLKVSQIG